MNDSSSSHLNYLPHFLRKTGLPEEKPLGAKERTINKLSPHMASTPEFKPGPHLWEASALTTAPSLASPTKLRLNGEAFFSSCSDMPENHTSWKEKGRNK